MRSKVRGFDGSLNCHINTATNRLFGFATTRLCALFCPSVASICGYLTGISSFRNARRIVWGWPHAGRKVLIWILDRAALFQRAPGSQVSFTRRYSFSRMLTGKYTQVEENDGRAVLAACFSGGQRLERRKKIDSRGWSSRLCGSNLHSTRDYLLTIPPIGN
jgi:hypothetical protein